MHPVTGRVLSIAGSDSGGGAGIQADIKTCTALGCYGMTAITAITAQNTVGVRSVFDLPLAQVQAQIDAVYEDIGVDAVKTGMLANAALVRGTAQALKKHHAINLVVDPVMISKSGAVLLREDAVETMKEHLIPMATVVCPNIPEAEALTGVSIHDEKDIETVLKHLYALGPQYVLLKGGHLESSDANDFLYDGRDIQVYPSPRIVTTHTHGTGCTYSAAIACFLSRQETLPRAVQLAKEYLTQAILQGGKLQVGHGIGPLHHGWNIGA